MLKFNTQASLLDSSRKGFFNWCDSTTDFPGKSLFCPAPKPDVTLAFKEAGDVLKKLLVRNCGCAKAETDKPQVKQAGFPLGALVALAAGAVLAWATSACDAQKSEELKVPDKPLPTPDGQNFSHDAGAYSKKDAGSSTDASSSSSSVDTSHQTELQQCVPDPCGGVIDYSRKQEDKALCLDFVETSNALTNSSVPHKAVSVIDYNNDKKSDVLLINDGVANQLFRNNGSGFDLVSQEAGLNFGGDTQSVAWGDANGDGFPDMMLVGNDGSDSYEQQAGVFVKSGIHNNEVSKAAAWVGKNPLIGTENGLRYYLNKGQGLFEEAAKAVGLMDSGDSNAIAVDDYDGDGNPDIYVANGTGFNRLFKGKSDGTFESVEKQTKTQGTGMSTDAKWVRHEGQANPALHVTTYEGAGHFFVKQDDGTFADKAPDLGLHAPGNTVKAAWGDFLNEKRPAVFLSRWQQPNLLYVPKLGADQKVMGYQDFAFQLKMSVSANTVGAEWLDADNDGDLDLLVVMADGGVKLHNNKSRYVKVCP